MNSPDVSQEAGNRFEPVADVDVILNGGTPGATTNAILKAILLELRLLRAAAVEPENGSGA